MSNTIYGIAIYPLEKYRDQKGEEFRDKIGTNCEVHEVPCKKEVNARIEKHVDYNIVCAVKVSEGAKINKISVEGSIKKTSVKEPPKDRILKKKELEENFYDSDGYYRQFWTWDQEYTEWKEPGTYEVHLKVIDKNRVGGKNETITEAVFPLIFTKTNYESEGYDIDSQCH